MKKQWWAGLMAALLLGPTAVWAQRYGGGDVEVEVVSDRGRTLPQYPVRESRGGVYKAYLEAVRGQNYSVQIRNRTNQRVGVVIAVDGRNIISGDRSNLRPDERMYVLGPYQQESYDGWRTGKNRVKGVEFGLAGNITDKLSGQAGITLMDSEVLESYTPANVGKTLSNFAEKSASALLRYQLTPSFGFGGAVKYESKRYAGQPDTAAAYDTAGRYTQPVPSYTVWDLFADYRIDKRTKVRLNVANLFDKDYYLAAYRSGSFLYKGDARNAKLTLNYEF